MFSSFVIILILLLYFSILIFIAKITSSDNSNVSFFLGQRKSPWYIVAYGMIGVSLSGITFLSVPGWVKTNEFFYIQMVLGYIPGYLFVARVLIPIYYKLNVYSIYEYLKKRFGFYSHKVGAGYFFLSRLLGASLRLFLVAEVLQLLLFDQLGVPFFLTTFITICLIWLYTYRGGIKTIIWTDTLQTTFMLLTVFLCIYTIMQKMGYSSISDSISQNPLSLNFFFFDDFNQPYHFLRSFFAGMFITIAMTGLDQDMMQKNLSCKTIGEAQKNMIWFSWVLLLVNILFLYLGALLYDFADATCISSIDPSGTPYLNISGDMLFVEVVKEGSLGILVFIFFVLGFMSASYSSADSALTSLTTSFCVDFLNMKSDNTSLGLFSKRTLVHLFVSFLLLCIIILVKYLNNDSIITTLFLLASYTYGPLLGLFVFGIFTNRKIIDKHVPFFIILPPIISYLISRYDTYILNGFDFGPDLIIINGLITFLILFSISKK